MAEWANRTRSQRQTSLLSLTEHPVEDQPDFIDLIKAPGNWGVYASDGPDFKYAIFGRDSLVVAEDILSTHPDLVKNIILTLAKLQGVKYDNISEEEPGKIHLEYRCASFGHKKAPEDSLRVLRDMQKLWGGVGTDRMTYYGAYDPTLLYVRLVGNYVKRYGRSVLGVAVVGQDGKERSMADSVKSAVDWVVNKLEDSGSGLIEYKRLNPVGLLNQAWKNSNSAYLTNDGQLPNFDRGIVSVELQGYAFDALQAAIYLFPEVKADNRLWQALSENVRSLTIDLLWMEGQRFFAQGLFYDNNGNSRLIDSLTSNAGLLLDSRLLYSLPDKKRQYYIEATARKLFSTEFITDAGIRSRALRHLQIPGTVDYHGSYTVWPKESNAISRGLRLNGYHALARQLDNRLINAILLTAEFFEFYYVDFNGNVWYDLQQATQALGERFPGSSLPTPQHTQAWTISAATRIKSLRILKKNIGASKFEKIVLKDIPNVEIINKKV